MKELIDLHTHTVLSDGTMTPEELVGYAEKKGLYALALTDHDTIGGIEAALLAASDKRVTVIPGIEISTTYQSRDIHILGLNIDRTDPGLLRHMEAYRQARMERTEKTARLLAADGYDISIEQLEEEFPVSVLTRSHISKHLMMKGYVSSITEGFRTMLDPGCRWYVPMGRISPEESIRLIHNAGGKAVLAHPLLYHFTPEELDAFVGHLKDEGLDGLEAIYSLNSGSDEADMKALATGYRLPITGGSDFHGSNKPDIDLGSGKGDMSVPRELLEPLFPGKF